MKDPDIREHQSMRGISLNNPRQVNAFTTFMESYTRDHKIRYKITNCNELLDKEDTHTWNSSIPQFTRNMDPRHEGWGKNSPQESLQMPMVSFTNDFRQESHHPKQHQEVST